MYARSSFDNCVFGALNFFMILPIIFYYSNTEIGIPTKGQNQVKQNKYRLKRR